MRQSQRQYTLDVDLPLTRIYKRVEFA